MNKDKQIDIDRETVRILQALSEELYGEQEPPAKVIKGIAKAAASENANPENLTEALANSLEESRKVEELESGESLSYMPDAETTETVEEKQVDIASKFFNGVRN